jgi:hypothetical protein
VRSTNVVHAKRCIPNTRIDHTNTTAAVTFEAQIQMSEATWQDTRQRFSIWTFLVVIFIVTINARFLVEIVVTFHLHKFLQTQSIHAFREKRVKQGKCMNL